MPRATNVLTIAFACSTVLLASTSAEAQNALGGGGALDANLGVGTGRVNLPTPAQDYRARNLLVTGNVAGGRGFRGTVGYGAEGDFRGVTGVDDLFRFRADAAISAPVIAARPGMDHIRFGRDLGMISLRRGDGGATAGMYTGPQQPGRMDEFRTQRPLDVRLRLDELTAGAGVTTRIEPPPIGTTVGSALGEGDRLMLIEVSPLRGVVAIPPEERAAQLGLTPYDIARLREDEARVPRAPIAPLPRVTRPQEQRQQPQDREPQRAPGQVPQVGVPYQTGFTALAEANRVQPGGPEVRVPMGTDEQMMVILERVAQRYAGRTDAVLHVDATVLDRLDEDYQELREQLARLSPGQRWRIEADLAAAQPDLLMDDDEEVDAERAERPLLDEDDVLARRPAQQEMPRAELDRLFAALRHGERIERLAPEGRTRFDELMAEAEHALRAGEYFNAERRFTRALRLVPAHPLAMIGAAHARLGAGLQLPASLSIRRVLIQYPELIDARYGADLLPSRPRLIQIVDSTLTRLEIRGEDRGEYGLLLAYIGHHLRDRELVERGLDLMDEATPDDSLTPVLRSVWLGVGIPEK